MYKLWQNLSSNPSSAAVLWPRKAPSSVCASFSSSVKVSPHNGVRSNRLVYPQPSEQCLAQRNHLVNVSDDLVFFHSTSILSFPVVTGSSDM